MVQFESLANELLLDLFEYLDTVSLLRAFLELNVRFNQLLYSHFRVHQFNFQYLSKEYFDLICKKHLSFLVDQLISIRLSNDETPNLPELLLDRGFTINRFIHLQSLSLYNIHSLNTLNKLIYQCRYLSNLTHLNIIKYYEGDIYKNIIDLLNNIWNLSKLISCNLNGIIHTDETSLSKISLTSSSIKYLSIENIPCNLTCLSHILMCTTNLERLNFTLYSYSLNDQLTLLTFHMKSIGFFFGGTLDSLKNLLEKMPNLSHLKIITSQIYLDGNIWQDLIVTYLSNLKKFQFRMEFDYQNDDDDMNDLTDQLLQTFRSSFWIDQHQWYVRCHWNPSDPYKSITLYTLPYGFDIFDYSNKSCTKSTCYDQRQYWSYDNVQIFGHNHLESTTLDSFSLIRARFPNIERLHINLPFDDMFWLRFFSFNYLQSVHISIYKFSGYCQLQTLFDQSPYLYSLKVESYGSLSTQLFELTSKSLRRLDLIDILIDRIIYFNKNDCYQLIHSSLGQQCQVLLIRLENRSIVLDLIENLPNLRLLIFESNDDRESFLNFSLSTSKNELIRWLQIHLSSTYSILRDPRKRFRIQIWIDRNNKKIFPSKQKTKFSKALTLLKHLFS